MEQLFKNKLLVLTAVFFLSGCENWVKEDTQNQFEITSAESLENALAGLYSYFNQSIIFFDPDKYITIFDLNFINTDDVSFTNRNTSITKTGETLCAQVSTLEEDSYIKNVYILWRQAYLAIINANNLIEKANNIENPDKKVRQLVGEAYFLRAHTYFRLVRFFGNVPIIDNTQIDFTIKKSSFSEIYSFIEKDLLKAAEYLPASNDLARIEFVTPHRGTALALLSEVYLTMGGYPLKDNSAYIKASSIARNIIDSSAFFGYSLLEDFANLWDNKYIKNPETVFSLFYSDVDEKQYYDYNNYTFTYLPFVWYRISFAGIRFYNSFPNDYRKTYTYRSFVMFNIGNYTYYDSTSLPREMDICSRITLRKFYTPNNAIYLNSQSKRNIYLLRYSHVLLTYAEAKARSGAIDALAYEAVNKVRRRANKVDLNTISKYDLQSGLLASQFVDSVVQERAWEFCGEPEGRFFDLLRLEKLGELPTLRFKGQGESDIFLINKGNWFFSIPDEDIKLNPNLSK
jgi:starch-binding outer membrane protein, SusD/RagB family